MRGDQTNTSVKPPVKVHLPGTSSRGRKRNRASVTDESQWQVVYSDGACKGNGKVGSIAGIGVFWRPNDPRSVCHTMGNCEFT